MDRDIIAYSIIDEEERNSFINGDFGTYEIEGLDLSLIEDLSIFQDGNAYIFKNCLISNVDLEFTDAVMFENCDFKGNVKITSKDPDNSSIDFLLCNFGNDLDSLEVLTPLLTFARSKIETNNSLILKAANMIVEPTYDKSAPNVAPTSNYFGSKGKIVIDAVDLSMNRAFVAAPNIRFGKYDMLNIIDSKIIGRTSMPSKEDDPAGNFKFYRNIYNSDIKITPDDHYIEEQEEIQKSL